MPQSHNVQWALFNYQQVFHFDSDAVRFQQLRADIETLTKKESSK
jgi:hypothetical protein